MNGKLIGLGGMTKALGETDIWTGILWLRMSSGARLVGVSSPTRRDAELSNKSTKRALFCTCSNLLCKRSEAWCSILVLGSSPSFMSPMVIIPVGAISGVLQFNFDCGDK